MCAVGCIEWFALGVATVPSVVAATVTQVDPAHEGYVIGRLVSMKKYHQLLVMRTHPTHSLVEQHLPPGRVDQSGEFTLFLLVEAEPPRMGVP
jgi:hypothetical protein